METEGGEGKIRGLSRFGWQQGQSKEVHSISNAKRSTPQVTSLTDRHLTIFRNHPTEHLLIHCLAWDIQLEGMFFYKQSELVEWFSATSLFCYLRFYTKLHIKKKKKKAQSHFHSKHEHQEIQAESHSFLLYSSEGSKWAQPLPFVSAVYYLTAHWYRFCQIQPLTGSARTHLK